MPVRAVVYRSELWSPPRLIGYSFLTGVTVYIGGIGLMAVSIFAQHGELPTFVLNYQRLWLTVGMAAVAGIPWMILWRCQSMVRTFRRALASGIACGCGAISLALVFSLGNPDPNHWLLMLKYGVYLCAFFGLSNVVLMLAYNRLRQPLPIQNGTLCPGCAYSLIGNVSMICPECGRPFNFAELAP